MQAYAIMTINEICLYRETEIDPREDDIAYDIIIAASRGKARAEFCRHFNIEYTEPLRIVKLCDDIDDDLSFEEFQALSVHGAVKMYDLSEEEEWLHWEYTQPLMVQP